MKCATEYVKNSPLICLHERSLSRVVAVALALHFDLSHDVYCMEVHKRTNKCHHVHLSTNASKEIEIEIYHEFKMLCWSTSHFFIKF